MCIFVYKNTHIPKMQLLENTQNAYKRPNCNAHSMCATIPKMRVHGIVVSLCIFFMCSLYIFAYAIQWILHAVGGGVYTA